VLRAIFRACYARFRHCVTKEKQMSRVSLEICPGREGHLVWGRKDEEYIADFCLVSQRSLTEFEYRVFKFHFLLGADWRLCTRRLGIDRGTFFHAVYRIEQKLGRVFRELEPYCLFPLDEYFHGSSLGRLRSPLAAGALQAAADKGGTPVFLKQAKPAAETAARHGWLWSYRRGPAGQPLRPPLLLTA